MDFEDIMRILFILILFPLFIAAQSDQLVEFKINDQFDRLHTHEEIQDTVVVLIGSGRPGSKYNMKWGHQLGVKLQKNGLFEGVIFVAHADLRGVPGFLRGFVKSKFPQEEEKWVLLDWDGVLARSYDYDSKTSNILIFNQKGSLVQHKTGLEPTEAEIDTLFQTVKQLVNRDPDHVRR